jgi:hypothetical protein
MRVDLLFEQYASTRIRLVTMNYITHKSSYMKELDCWISRRKHKSVSIYAARWLPRSPHNWVDG